MSGSGWDGCESDVSLHTEENSQCLYDPLFRLDQGGIIS